MESYRVENDARGFKMWSPFERLRAKSQMAMFRLFCLSHYLASNLEKNAPDPSEGAFIEAGHPAQPYYYQYRNERLEAESEEDPDVRYD